MKSKFMAGVMLIFVIFAAVLTVRAEDADLIGDGKELFKHIQLFADSMSLISSNYVEPIKAKDLVYGAIKGMMNTLDGYSQFLNPENFKDITEETKGEFGGLGIEVGMRDGILTVITPMEGTPAYISGLRSGDKIVKIDEEITSDIAFHEAVEKLRGRPGTDIKITVIREDVDKMLNFVITRAVIKIKSVKEVEIIEDSIGYVKLVGFQERTARDLRAALQTINKKNATSLILDLRNNPGGLLDASIDAADLFLEKGTLIVYTEGRDPSKRIEYNAKKNMEFSYTSLVVLVNKGSASAAEILAGALKDNKTGLIVGSQTFGKGSVQTVIPLKDESALRLTTASYFTPSGKNLMNKGIAPDVVVKKRKTAKKEKQGEQKSTDLKKTERKKKRSKKKNRRKKKKTIKEYDNQLQTAINIIKGIQIYKRYELQNTEQ